MDQDSLFPKLNPEQLDALSKLGQEVRLKAGETVFTQGEPADNLYVVLEGTIKITKEVEGDEVTITVHHPGEFTGELSLLTRVEPQIASGRALEDTRLLKISAEALRQTLVVCPTLADTMLSAMTRRVQDAGALLQQREKLAALGKLAAGLAHELNNPAAAGGRAAEHLRCTFAGQQSLTFALNCHDLTPQQRAFLPAFVQKLIEQEAPPALDPLEQSDKEDALSTWMEDRDVSNGWELAPAFVAAGLDMARLDALAANVPEASLGATLQWLHATLEVNSLVGEVQQSTTRIAKLVKAIKEYSYMDQAPLQQVDVHEGLDSTLTMLGHKFKKGSVQLKKDYAQDLPRLCAHGSELNQVWTNLLDNALDALDGKGHITIRTARENEKVLVEITDDGPGIAPEIQSRIWEPFFTTKGVGQGSGLGLDIAYRLVVKRHGGDIKVDSKPGETRFQVRLPIEPKCTAGE